MFLLNVFVIAGHGKTEPDKLVVDLIHRLVEAMGNLEGGGRVCPRGDSCHVDGRLGHVVDIREDGFIFVVPESHVAIHVDAKGLVPFLQTAESEVFEMVDILTENQLGFLSSAKCKSRHKT